MSSENDPRPPTPEAVPDGDPSPLPPVAPDPGSSRGRRLSVLRMGMAALVIGAAGLGSTRVTIHTLEERDRLATQWFAPYVDVTLPPFFNFQDPVANPNKDVALAFVVASPEEPCTPSWGASYDLDAAATELDLDRRIVRHRQRGGDVIVSFGGVANDELAVACTDPAELTAAYAAVVERYDLRAVDLDVEAGGLDPEASARRAAAVARVQDDRAEAGTPLEVWVTLPVAPDGLRPEGVAVVDDLLEAGVDLAGVNVMAMEFGGSRGPDMDFVEASLAALDATAAQLRSAYRRAGTTLAEPASYAKLGLTPMIGQNDAPDDRLDPDDARRLVDQASRRGVTRFSMWSLNRDAPCSGNVDPTISSPSCSGVEQERLEFSAVFGTVDGRATGPVSMEETPGASGRVPLAVEATGISPYDEWRSRREYDMAAKVVWRGQVYEAKWWNVGAQPDAPVEDEWDSPWRILGPVLPTDRPVAALVAHVPDGTFPTWTSRTGYEAGDRVQHQGVAYRAKWWTQGDDPTADVDNTWQSAWEPLPPSAVAEPAPEPGPEPEEGDPAPSPAPSPTPAGPEGPAGVEQVVTPALPG